MKRFFNYSLLAALAASSFALTAVQAQPARRPAPRPQTQRAKPTPTPTPLPTPPPAVATIAETPLAPGARARFDVTNYRVEA